MQVRECNDMMVVGLVVGQVPLVSNLKVTTCSVPASSQQPLSGLTEDIYTFLTTPHSLPHSEEKKNVEFYL